MTLLIPGDKSISHRAVIFGALAKGKTVISNLLESEDVLRTISIFRQLGVSIKKQKGKWTLQGIGLNGLKA
ncbi:MAG: 3-phosphoshikimate 1-carboxyvinyltransferase, partial [bacterium]|nr:3-phosphoshikimate 1-carboxyvinyltransferase [bacterium]